MYVLEGHISERRCPRWLERSESFASIFINLHLKRMWINKYIIHLYGHTRCEHRWKHQQRHFKHTSQLGRKGYLPPPQGEPFLELAQPRDCSHPIRGKVSLKAYVQKINSCCGNVKESIIREFSQDGLLYVPVPLQQSRGKLKWIDHSYSQPSYRAVIHDVRTRPATWSDSTSWTETKTCTQVSPTVRIYKLISNSCQYHGIYTSREQHG